MRKDKKEARNLRRSGKSYSEISKILGIPKSTLSGWFSKEVWSSEVRSDLAKSVYKDSAIRLRELNRVRGQELEKSYKTAQIEARDDFESLKDDSLFIAGLMLYWGEGDKTTKHLVRLTNTDAEMIRLYIHFLQRTCGVSLDKIRAQLLVYPDLHEPEVRSWWISKTGLPEGNFAVSTLIQGRHPTKRLGRGVCIIYTPSTYLKVKMLTWLALVPKGLMNSR